jgi:hypothetical protein
MTEIFDFTNCPENPRKSYLGANGSKKCLIINGQDYMVKFPAAPTKNDELSYTNSCISEYVACHIFEVAEIPVQKTFFATKLTARHSLILSRSYNKLIEKEKSLNLKSSTVKRIKSRDDDYDKGR